MACGADIIKSLEKTGCLALENIDGDVLDWYLEDPDLEKFLRELCSRIDCGHLRPVGNTADLSLKQELTFESLLGPKCKENQDIKEKISQLKNDLPLKRDRLALLKMKLKMMKKLNIQADQQLTLLQTASSNNHTETMYQSKKLQPLNKQVTEALKTLAKSHHKMLSDLLECPAPSGRTASVKSASLNVPHLSSLSSSTACDNHRYIEKEKSLLNALSEENSDTRLLTVKQHLDSDVHLLIQDWQNELVRLHHCFFITMKTYNHLRGLESALRREIKFLQDTQDWRLTAKEISMEIQEARAEYGVLEVQLKDTTLRSEETCKEAASEALSVLLLTNKKIKLQRVQQHRRNAEMVLQALREEQSRLNVLQLWHKIESQRYSQLLLLSKSINGSLKRHQSIRQNWVEPLLSLKKSQERHLTEVVPADDKVMESLAEVLGRKKDELILQFDSVVKAAEAVNLRIAAGDVTNRDMLDNMAELELIFEVLFSVQEQFSASSQYHGCVNLAQGMSKLKERVKSYTARVLDYQTSFEGQKKDLENCKREVFQRELKMKTVIQKINQTK